MMKPAFGTPINWESPFSKGLVASFPMNEGPCMRKIYNNVDGRAADMVGFGAADTPTSGWTAGPHGGALACDANDGVTLPLSDAINTMSAFTVSFFIERFNNSKTNLFFLGKGTFRTAFDMLYSYITAGPIIQLYIGLSMIATPVLDCTQNLSIVGAYDGQNASIYINGALRAGPTPLALLQNNNVITIGKCVGKISCFCLHSRALSPEEVAYLNAFPYCMYEQDDAIFAKPFDQNFYRRLLAGGC